MIAVAILLPWLALMIRGYMFQGLICLLLQITLIGWLPAAIWALVVVNNDNQERRHRELLDSLQTAGAGKPAGVGSDVASLATNQGSPHAI
jgi:uncharacterized membrane protein YqaE (UPF0057 family)